MFDYRHSAINIRTGEILNCSNGNHLKRQVAYTQKFDKENYGVRGQWRFSHDYGKSWDKNGVPTC